MKQATQAAIRNANTRPVVFIDAPEMDLVGAVAMKMPSKAHRALNGAPEQVQSLPTNSLAIIIGKSAQEILTPRELTAIIEHERGHIALKHLSQAKKANIVGGIIDSQVMEIEADNYAVQRGVKGRVLASAIRKLTANAINSVSYAAGIVEATGKEPTKRFLSDMIKTAELANRPRYAALGAL
jgi:Zn-dependent protease with chaperone function